MSRLSRILVATDFSPLGHAAIARAGQLAKDSHAELHLIHATPDWNLFSRSISVDQAIYASVTRHAESALQRDIDWLWTEYGVRARGAVHLGNATHCILRLASEFRPSLLVIGARGEHAPLVGPAALGGTTLKLIAHVTFPLLLVRHTDMCPYRETLVAMSDARDLSTRLALWGATLAPGSICHAIRAYEVPYSERVRVCGVSESAIAACVEDARVGAQQTTDEVVRTIQGYSEVRTHVISGEPLAVVLTEIVRDRVQLLVVGKHGQRPDETGHALFGSVGVRIAYHAPIDVLVVP